MVSRDVLLLRAGPAPRPSVRPAADRIDEALNQLRGRKPRALGPAGRAPQFAFKPEKLKPVAKFLFDNDGRLPIGTGVELLRQLLASPTRMYELSVEHVDLRRHALLGAFDFQDDPSYITVARLTAPQLAKDWPGGLTLELDVHREDDDLVLETLADVAAQRVPSLRGLPDPDVPDPPGLLWVGGSAGELADASGWRERISAFAAARGMTVEIIEQPARRLGEARQQIHDFAGVLAVWKPYCSGHDQELFDRGHDGRRLAIADQVLSEALIEAGWGLAELPDPEVVVAPAWTAPEPGEVRYYKKQYSRQGGGDKMVQTGDCRHSNWRVATRAKAPQAARGLDKAERGTPWSKLEKCVSCTSNGFWKVTFDARQGSRSPASG